MRLKELELHGYKTFAGKTRFVFQGGLTAIIGPNGSGKSNVADAIQWVLGEQSYTSLRAKRSEDMIFSGSNERSRMGMAQVTLTLDNLDGWLPIDYGEVVIGRRTYRSGENEYYLNGAKVRLRDITDLLSQSGLSKRTYTVIGQGLVDQALSLRPDERRALIEEAAGITGHQGKRGSALRQLEETRHNLERVQDILEEIEPRLRYLKRQAERAEERMQVQADLDTQLRLWYGHRWHQAVAQLQLVVQGESEARVAVEARRSLLHRLAETDESLRQRHGVLRVQLGDWHRESAALHSRSEVVQRELAVGSERLRQLKARREDLERELEPMEDRLAGQQEQVQAVEAALNRERAELAALHQQVAESQRNLGGVEAQRATHRQRLARAQEAVAKLGAELAGLQRRLVEQESRQRTMAEEHQRLQAELEAAETSQADLAPQIAQGQARLAEIEGQSRSLADQRQAQVQGIAITEGKVAQLAEELARQRRHSERLQDQLELLQRLHDEGEGYSGGTRSILRSTRSAHLTGIIGTVADQLRVPAELEVAIETALGGRLQDVIVEAWADAEAAIAWLKGSGGGRATFLPLDTLRTSPRLPRATGPGVIGVAADLVQVEPRLAGLLEYLLGRVVVTHDLATARRVLDAGRERPTVVTLEGDIVRPGGSVSGGSSAKRQDQGVLARERSLREMPVQIDIAQRQLAELQQAAAQLEDALQAQRRDLAEHDLRLSESARLQQLEGAALAKLQGQAGQIARELTWRLDRLAATEKAMAGLDAAMDQGREGLAGLEQRIEDARAAGAGAETDLATLDTAQLAAEVMQRRSAANVVATRVSSQEQMLASQLRELSQVEQEIQLKQARMGVLHEEQTGLQSALEEQRSAAAGLSAEIEAYQRRIGPAEDELAALEAERSQLAAEELAQRQASDREEDLHYRAQLALQRSQDELAHLRAEIDHDVGLVELERGDLVDSQPPLPLRPLVERLPAIEVLPEGVDQEIRRLRSLYSRLGSVNPNAPEEYAAAQERHEFLTTQAADLNEAAASLETVIKELDEVMQQEFLTTFWSVARQFKDQFTALFGGGTARLELSEPDIPLQSGIEIVVRPPGKRAQPLPLLSGGERSLTAAALILAILKVSPPPFCILDEVDAALDEANINRFRAALREVAEQTQFIVITHNRGTIEVADTIYGISMGSDSTSQALSLRLEERAGQRELVAA